MSLQSQLEGTENRINVARIVFNDSVRDYNSSIRKIPGSLVAGLGSFQRKAYFQADGGAGNVSVGF
ncbi:MAG: LemA family protein [Pseudomonadales bacterium]|nr:LemA family protein [Pseudomonadales bacterium]